MLLVAPVRKNWNVQKEMNAIKREEIATCTWHHYPCWWHKYKCFIYRITIVCPDSHTHIYPNSLKPVVATTYIEYFFPQINNRVFSKFKLTWGAAS